MHDVTDADALAARFDPPTVRLGGRVYRGRILSIEEWDPFQTRIERIQSRDEDDKLGQAEMIALFREYGNAVFGRRRTWWEWTLGIAVNPTERLLKLPPNAMLDVFLSFFSCQGRAIVGTDPKKKTPTSG